VAAPSSRDEAAGLAHENAGIRLHYRYQEGKEKITGSRRMLAHRYVGVNHPRRSDHDWCLEEYIEAMTQ
jgi:hypothetical protein